ncbi:MAG: NADH-quinone oxidoreductase subunit A [Actinomycetales bacterium]
MTWQPSVLIGTAGDPRGYLVVATVVAVGIVLVLAGMTANRLLRPQHATRAKSLTYESGVDPVGAGWQQLNIRYYLYAYLYVVFAVDAVYLFPWATVVALLGLPTLVTMGVFLGVLAVALVYAWRAGVLRWT